MYFQPSILAGAREQRLATRHLGAMGCEPEGMAMTDSELTGAIVDQAPDAIVFADSRGRIRLWNRAAERLFGYVAGDVIGKSLDIIIPERLRASHWSAFDRAIESGRTQYEGRVMTTRSMRSDGSKLYVDMSFALVADAAGSVVGAVAFVRDATSRYESERAMRERIAELERGGGQSPIEAQDAGHDAAA